MPVPRRISAGFTLVELMVTVAIVAILAAIAFPSYRSYVIRGQLVDATNGLSAMSADMERYFQDNRNYNGTTPPSPCTTPPTYGSFTVTCPTLSDIAYTLQATGSGSTAGFTFSIDQQGNKSSTAPAALSKSGWGNCSTAWETKPGQC